MSVFPTSFLVIQNSHDKAVFTRHKAGRDLGVICINNTITVDGLVDSEMDSQTFDYAANIARQTKVIHVLGPDLAPNTFGAEYNIGNPVTITYANGNVEDKWQITMVTQSPDGGNMVDITIIERGEE